MRLVQIVTRVVALLALLAVPSATAEPRTVLALSGRDYREARLVELDRATLQPTGRSLDARGARSTWSYSPDGKRVAIWNSHVPTTGRAAGLLVVDVARMRAVQRVRVPGSLGYLRALAWVTPERLVALAIRPGGGNVVFAIDAGAGATGPRRAVDGIVVGGRSLPTGLVLLAAPRRGIGAARLVTVDAALTVRETVLPGIRAGWGTSGSATEPAAHRLPGLAVDPAGTRAFVVGAGEAPVTVDLRTLEATAHAVRSPQARAKSLVGPVRRADWVGEGVLAVSGLQYAGLDPKTRRFVEQPAGLTLLDTRTWRETVVDEDASSFQVAGGRVLVGRRGLAAYDTGGTPLWTALDGRRLDQLRVLGDRVFAHVSGEPATRILDLRTGRELGRRAGVVPLLLGARTSGL
jgi:hypothetical protein